MSIIEQISELMQKPTKIRNIALVAHIDHGKTTLSDSLLVTAGFLAPTTAGEARALDYLPEEQRRGITMKTANISLIVQKNEENHLINLIDSPGHVDFSGKVARALRIVDGAIVIIDAVEQIMAQTETVIRQCITEGVKPVLFINKIDRLINELKLNPKQIAERIEIIYNAFNKLVEKFSLNNNLPKWRSTTRDGSVVFGSALHRWAISIPIAKKLNMTFDEIVNFYKNNQIELLQNTLPIEKPLIDMIIDHLPNPIEAQKYRIDNIWKGDIESPIGKAMVKCESNETTPLVFGSTKIVTDAHAGRLLIGRVFSGILKEKMNIRLVNSDELAKIRNIYIFMGQDKKRINNVPAGNTIAISGLEKVKPGETITSTDLENFIAFEEIKYLANPVVTVAIEPKMLRDLPQLKRTLEKYDQEDPNLLVTIDEKSGEMLLLGLGELHLETVVKSISEEIECEASSPIVIIVEKIAKNSGIISESFFGSKVSIKAELNINLEEKNTENACVEKLRQYNNEIIISEKIITNYNKEAIENILLGAKEALKTGPILSKPVFGVKIYIENFEVETEEKYEHTVPLLRNAIWKALKKGDITPQEPIYKIQITTPAPYLGKVSSIIKKRRGDIIDVRSDQDLLVITGFLPGAESFRIDQDLRSNTEGRAFWQMSFEEYKPMPSNILDTFKK